MSETVRPYLSIRPGHGWAALDLREIWQFRDLLTTLAARDVKLRYRQTALGAVWVILQPLLAAGIFTFVFGTVAGLKSDGPYFPFAYAGLLGWNAFSSTLTKASNCLLGNSQLVSKVFFPRLVLPLSTVFSTLVDFGVALAMMAALMVLYGSTPGLGLLLLPVWLLLMLLLAMGVGLFASALMVTYRDIGYILPVLTSFLMYASPVAYATSRVPEKWRALFLLNPLSPLLDAFRWSLLNKGTLHVGSLLYAALVAGVMFVGGAFAFKRMERRFADVI